MKESRILVLRHAETAAPDRFHGAESDVGLGARGRGQAEAVARVVAVERPSVIHTSAMRRAVETARPIGRACGLAPLVEPLLHERKMGPLSGLDRAEGLDAYNDAKRRWMAGEVGYTHPGGESYADVRDRIVPVFERIAAGAVGRTVVVVAHGVVIRVLLTSVLEGRSAADFERFAIDNTALNDLRHDGRAWTAVTLNQRIGTDFDGFAW